MSSGETLKINYFDLFTPILTKISGLLFFKDL